MASVTIGNSVTTVGEGAFNGCSGLTLISIPNSVESIGDYAFSGCSGLTSVSIPNSVATIGNYAFSGCSGLTSVSIPNSVESIGDYAFKDCTGLASVTMPQWLSSIVDYAFKGCSSIRSITFKGFNPPTICQNTFEDVSSSAAIIVPCECQTAYIYARYFDYFDDITPDCGNTCGDNGGENGGNGSGSDTTTVTHGDTVYVYVTIHDTACIIVHDTICPEATSISPTVVSDINIYTMERQIVVEGATSLPVIFYDMQGRMLETTQSHGDNPVRFDAPATGIYMVRVGNLSAQRVAILR